MKKILSYSIFLACVTASASFGAEQCLMKFSACPKTFHNDTIVVPEKVAAIAPDVLVFRGRT
jgi:hypothetical protein